ncbi:MAG: Maf family protein [candidate division WOR-3 bacterium]|jgi:septum formation protein
MRIILASSSARRKEIFKQLGIKAEIKVPAIGETILKTPVETVVCNATRKATWVHENQKSNVDSIVLGFDTLVFLEGKILGKPVGRKDSIYMLKSLSGKWHEVYTGIAVLKNGTLFQDYDKSDVKFHRLTNSQISYYIDSGENLDKAGSYGIQDKNMSFIEKIEGSFSNVIGFPLEVCRNLLKKIGVHILEDGNYDLG